MSMEYVLDCSVTLTWFFIHEASLETDQLLTVIGGSGQAVVPQHWFIELGNVLLIAERRKGKSQADTTQFIILLQSLNILMDQETADEALAGSLNLAREHQLTLYDACYLEVALRRGLPLASLDRDLRMAARKVGVKCLPADLQSSNNS